MARSSSRKRKAAGDDEPKDPQALIAQVREEEQRKLKSRGQDGDLDHLIRTVQAILGTNKEIWERCEQHRFTTVSGSSPTLHFQRFAFSKIQVKTTKPGSWYSSMNSGNTLSFKSTAEFETKDFGVPPPPPEQLTRNLVLNKTENGDIPDYEQLFRSSLLLHEDVLVPFLGLLKKHLESIQVYLGTIDAWLMQPSVLVAFIEEHFSVGKLELPTAGLKGCEQGCSQQHDHYQKCLRCGESFRSHNDAGYEKFRCPRASNFGDRRASYFHGKTHTLKSCQTSGEHTQTFDISKESDQERLVRFLGYVSFSD